VYLYYITGCINMQGSRPVTWVKIQGHAVVSGGLHKKEIDVYILHLCDRI